MNFKGIFKAQSCYNVDYAKIHLEYRHLKRLLTSIVIFVPLLCWSYAAHAGGFDLGLLVELSGFPEQEMVKDKKIEFKKACAKFGEYLSKNRGLWGSGPFNQVSCGSARGGKQNRTSWLLRVSGDSSKKLFEIFYREKTGKISLQSSYSIQTEVGPLTLMAGDNGEKIAFYLTSAMPFRSILAPDAKPGSNRAALKGPIGFLKNMTPPKTLEVFTLQRRNDFWLAQPIGRLSLNSETSKSAEWVLAELNDQNIEDEPLFVAQVESSGETLEQVDKLIKSGAESFFDKFLNFGRSAYVGARYGFPLKGQGVMKKAPLVGFFGEFKSGLFSGFRINYDLIPEQVFTDELGTSSFVWSRLQLGYSFSKNLNSRFINSVDVTPRLGIATLKYDFAPRVTSDATAYSFNLNRAPTIGVEFGAEKATNYFRLRGWTYGSYSVGVLPIDKNHTTTSLRIGLDVYREFLNLRAVKLAVLGFGAAESTKIQKKLSDNQIATETTLVNELQLNSTFLGGGVTLTW